MIGRILKGVGGTYDVYADGIRTPCRLRGALRREDRICVGDFVQFDPEERIVTEILPRKNFLLRPSVSNVDCVVFVIAPVPKPDFLLLDKVLVRCAREGVPVLLCANKSDLSDAFRETVFAQYEKSGAEFAVCSAKTGEGIGAVRAFLKGKLACLAGQSAVGKSSLANALFPELSAETGGLAKRTDRGKHTTRHSEIYPAGDVLLCDTPGFSEFQAEGAAEDLQAYYPEFRAFDASCRFRTCTHVREPDCAVRRAAENGEIPRERYERYLALFEALKRSAERFPSGAETNRRV